MNNCTFAGRVGRVDDPRKAGSADVVSWSLAVSRSYKDREGTWQDVTTWIACESWGPQAGYVERNLGPGDVVAVAGELEIQEWERDGQKHRKPVIRVREVQRLARKAGGGGER